MTSENVVYSGFYYINYGNYLAFPNVRAPEDLERGSSFSDFDFFMRLAAIGEKKMNKTIGKNHRSV